MTTTIWFEDKFGEQCYAGLAIKSFEDDKFDVYELLAIKAEICDDLANMSELEGLLNVDCREGYAIYPLRDSYQHYVWYDYPKRLVRCLAIGMWG